MNLTIDTFAWVEILRDSRAGRAARDAIDSAELCYTPSIVVAEFANACARSGLSDGEIAEELRGLSEATHVVPIETDIAVEACHALVELRLRARRNNRRMPGLSDGLVLATARLRESSILSGDPHFEGLPETVWMEQA